MNSWLFVGEILERLLRNISLYKDMQGDLLCFTEQNELSISNKYHFLLILLSLHNKSRKTDRLKDVSPRIPPLVTYQ